MRRYLDYKDTFITIFNDDDKCMVVFLNDYGNTKAICYDDNFFYVESLVDTYFEMILSSFKYWCNRALDDSDYKEIKEHLKKYIKHLKRQTEVDEEAYSKEVRGLLGL